MGDRGERGEKERDGEDRENGESSGEKDRYMHKGTGWVKERAGV